MGDVEAPMARKSISCALQLLSGLPMLEPLADSSSIIRYADNLDVDVLIVGAGFGGTFLLHEMRKAGHKTVLYEAGTSFGGTWRWNIYPVRGLLKPP